MILRMRSSRRSSAAPSRAASIEEYRAEAWGNAVAEPRLIVGTSLNMRSLYDSRSFQAVPNSTASSRAL
jgi:hypothetical protein